MVEGIGRCRQVAAINRRTPGGVGDDGAIAKKLGHQLDIWSFTAAGAGAGEFKQRLQELDILDLPKGELLAIEFRQAKKEFPVLCFALSNRRLWNHIQRFVAGVSLALCRAYIHAKSTTGAVFRRNLERVLHTSQVFPARGCGKERIRSADELLIVIDLGADDGMRANQHALAALNAQFLVPLRNFQRNISLFPLRGAGRESAIYGQLAHRQKIAIALDDRPKYITHKFGSLR